MGKKKVIDNVLSLLGAQEDKVIKKERQKRSKDFSSEDTLKEDLNELNELELEEYLEEQGLDEFDLMNMGVLDLDDESVQIAEKGALSFFSYSPKEAGKNWIDSGNTDNLLEYMSTELDDPKKLRDFMDGLSDDTVTFDDYANEDIQNHADKLLEEMKTLRVIKNEGSLLGDIPKSQFADKDIKAAEKSIEKRREFFERDGEVFERVPLDSGEDMPSSFLRRATSEETSNFKKGRENFRVGKLVKGLFGDKPTAISELLHFMVERRVDKGATKKEAFKEISENTKLPIKEIEENEKIFSRLSGGGASKDMVDEVMLTGKSLLRSPTALQESAENIAGGKGTKSTRIARRKAGKAAIGGGVLGYLLGELDLPPEKASEFEQAFSEAHNSGEETFTFDGKEFSTEVKKGKAMGGTMYNKGSLVGNQTTLDANKDGDITGEDFAMLRNKKQEGGSMLVPPEMEAMAEDMPVDTYPNIPPEEMAEVEASQLPDADMEKDYMDFVVGESLDSEEQNYLMNALEADPQLSQIFGKVVTTASEFTGSGEVSGPGTGVSDSIPARLSDGEFVFTKKATDQMGSDNLQMMMDDAERAFDGGEMRMPKQEGGMMMYNQKDEDPLAYEKIAQDEIKKNMLRANRAPSLLGVN